MVTFWKGTSFNDTPGNSFLPEIDFIPSPDSIQEKETIIKNPNITSCVRVLMNNFSLLIFHVNNIYSG
jgi:hypothetical protein